MTDCAAALRSLAARVRAGLPLRPALERWHETAQGEEQAALLRVSRRLALGCSLERALVPARRLLGDHTVPLALLLSLHAQLGGHVAASLDALADVAEIRARREAAADAAAAGVMLSARTIAALPLVLVGVAPLTRAPVLDASAIALLIAAGTFAVVGMRWIRKLSPGAPPLDRGALFARLLAALLRGGAPLAVALDRLGCYDEDVARAARKVRLGASWPEALRTSADETLAALGRELESVASLGVPLAQVLERLAAQREASSADAFERAVRRAPVKMLVPLSLCVLPAYLLAAAPLLRGLFV